MKIFVINLERSFERKLALQRRFNELGLTAEFIKAVDGNVLTQEDIKAKTCPLNYAFLPGEIGCALSHQLVYKKMLDEGISDALILEDDVLLPDTLPELLNACATDSEKPEVLLLSRVNKYFKNPVGSINGKFKVYKIQHATTTHSYIINLPAARNLLKALHPVWMTADKWSLFEDYSLLNVKAVIPAPVELSSAAAISTINGNKGDGEIDRKKQHIWKTIMESRPVKVKIKHRIRRGLAPLLHSVVNQGKGP